jgi:peptidoglycan glycosyltransferase
VARLVQRPAAGGFVSLALGAAVVSWLALQASADLARGRERLLAGDVGAARRAYERARRWWPPAGAAARAGRAAAEARGGRPVAEDVPAALLETLAPEALVLSAIDEGRPGAAAAVANLSRRAGFPDGALYAAALALDRGDEAAARSLAAQGTVPLESRGLGPRLRRALAALDAGRTPLLLDRHGELAATVVPGGPIVPEDAVAPLLAGFVGRMPALPAGRAVRLSIDLSLSRAALDALAGYRGSVVLVDPATGAVLAAVSDERTAAAEGAAAFVQRREPASIAKILTAAAAYRAGIDPDAAIARMTCTGVERYGGKPLWCPWPAGPLEGLDHALAVSCNVAFANLGVRVGVDRLVQEYRLWGFDAGEDTLLGAAGRLRATPRTPLELAQLSVGLELPELTPLHAALIAATVANGGRLEEPRLVTGACGLLGLSDVPLPPGPGRAVLDPAVARRLMQAMRAVAERGTGAGLAPPTFPVAMKTGTGADRGRYHVNYVGAGPLPDPTVAFCVRVTHGSSSPAVTRAAREVTRRLLRALAERQHLLPRPGAVRSVQVAVPRVDAAAHAAPSCGT